MFWKKPLKIKWSYTNEISAKNKNVSKLLSEHQNFKSVKLTDNDESQKGIFSSFMQTMSISNAFFDDPIAFKWRTIQFIVQCSFRVFNCLMLKSLKVVKIMLNGFQTFTKLNSYEIFYSYSEHKHILNVFQLDESLSASDSIRSHIGFVETINRQQLKPLAIGIHHAYILLLTSNYSLVIQKSHLT